MGTTRTIGLGFALLLLAVGCSRPMLRDNALPSKTKDQYTKVKRVAVFPFENYSDTKEAERSIEALLIPTLRSEGIFDEVEDTRFVRDSMKKLKITSTESLEKEVLKKLGDEMNVQGILYGKLLLYGKGKEKDSASQVTMDMAMVDPSTGTVLWVGNVSAYGGLTVGKVFGVTEGKTDIEVAREAVRYLGDSMTAHVVRARDREKKGIIADLKNEASKEELRLKALKGETGKIQEQLDKAKAEAKGIKDSASKEVEALKSDMELQKAALESEKAKTQQQQQEIDQDKLKVEMEKKKVSEEQKKLEDDRKAIEEAKKKAEEEAAAAKKAAPAPAPAPEPAPSAEPAPAAAPATPAAEAPAPAPAPEPAPAEAPAK